MSNVYNARMVDKCSAQVFKRAGHQFLKRAFSARYSMIKKALTTVISTFYQHFDDYFCDGHWFDSSLFILSYNRLQINDKLLLFLGKKIFYLFGSLKRAACANFKI